MTLLSSRQVVVRIAAIIFVAEFLIMLVLGLLPPHVDPVVIASLDVLLLAAVSTPAIHYFVIRSFVSARDDALARVGALALTDPLTQLANRRMLTTHLEKIIAGSLRHRVRAALLLFDLDGFKRINDEYGHEAGDAVLVEVARRLKTVTRDQDIPARIGGDEFVVVLHRLNADRESSRTHSLEVAKRLIDLVSQPVDFQGKALQVGASVGIRILGDPEELAPDAKATAVSAVISDADAAMYAAKQAGKGRATVFGDPL